MLNIKENISLASFTTLKVGGSARFFVEAAQEEDVLEAVKFTQEKKLPVFVLGGGSNILVSDKGFDGVVIKILNTKYQIPVEGEARSPRWSYGEAGQGRQDTKVECGAGCLLGKIVNESVKSGLTGLEWASGIPGTIGGAIRGNAGAFGGEMADIVKSVKVLEIPNSTKARPLPSAPTLRRDGIPQSQAFIINYEAGSCMFNYRGSIFKQNSNLIILSAILNLKKGNKEESRKKIGEILKQRKSVQPFDFPSSGSFFKNPIVRNGKLLEEYEKDTGNKAKDNIVPAGYIIDALGLRGKKIGGAIVSQQHGNFLVNAGGAKTEDFVILAAFIKSRARNKFGVQLQEEVQMVGF